MIARGKYIVDMLNQAALEAGLINEIPAAPVVPVHVEPEAQETPVVEASSPIVDEGLPVLEKVDFKKRGRGRPKGR